MLKILSVLVFCVVFTSSTTAFGESLNTSIRFVEAVSISSDIIDNKPALRMHGKNSIVFDVYISQSKSPTTATTGSQATFFTQKNEPVSVIYH